VALGGMRVSEFVVEADPAAVARTRALLLRTKRTSAWSAAIGAVLVVAIGVTTVVVAGFPASWLLTATVVVGLALAADARHHFIAAHRMRTTWAAIGMPREMMRLSLEGLRCRVDTAPEPCFLPWPCVREVRLRGRLLTVELTPGPGASGLDQPSVRRAARRGELRFPAGALTRRPEEIDQALAAFTAGRLRIH
jgi:hypothetical protein